MEEYSAECGGHGCLFLFPAESLSAWQCSASCGSISKLNAADSFSRCCAPERRQAQNSQNNCRRAGNAGPCTNTTVVAWPVHTSFGGKSFTSSRFTSRFFDFLLAFP